MCPLRSLLGRLLFLAVLCALPDAARGAYLRRYPVSLRQPDGSSIRVYLTGDEFTNCAADARGYLLVRDPATGFVVYASRSADGRLVPTRLVAGAADPARAGLLPGAAPPISAEGLARWKAREEAQRDYRARRTHNTGAFNNLIVFIRFSDEQPSAFTHAVPEYDAMVNGAPGAVSMRSYYHEASYGALTIDSAYFPAPSGTTVVSFQADHPRAYYAPYDPGTNPDGYLGSEGGQREAAMLRAAIDFVRPQIEASGLDVDVDHDGWVDNIVFIVDGDTTAWATVLWPHAAWLGESTIAGAQVGSYNLQLEAPLFSGPGAGVGVLCHEMFHSLGAPDLYHYNGNGVSPAGPWDLMDGGISPPGHMLAYMKWKYGGWLPDIPEITASGTYALHPATAIDCAFRIRSPNARAQFFVVEYRRQSGLFESALPGSGLLVYRIDPSVTGNAGGPPDEVYVYRPNGTPTQNGDVWNAFYASTAGRTAINDATNPASLLQDGSPGWLDVRNIGAPGDTIGFDVRLISPPATRVGFTVQPGPARPNEPFANALQVTAQTDLGRIDPAATGAVTLDIRTGSGADGARLGGTCTVPLVNGRATFPDLSVDTVGSAYVLTASAPGLLSGESAPFSITPSGAATARVNLSSTHKEAQDPWSDGACLSANGRYAAFVSAANNIAASDTNGLPDVFVRNLATGAVQIASVSTSGAPADSDSGSPCLSATGRYVVFDSWASNLSAEDYGGLDVFLRDTLANTTERVSLRNDGGSSNWNSYSGAVSADGRFVAFQSSADNLVEADTNGQDDIFVRDRQMKTTTRITHGWDGSEANGGSSRHLTMSDDGSFVAFQSDASNLVEGDTNGRSDIFVWSRATDTIERVSVSTDGKPGNAESWDASMSPDGSFVVFSSNASNLVEGDTNGCCDIFVRDRFAHTTERVSLTSNEEQANNSSFYPDITEDGRYVCWESYANNLAPSDTNNDMDIFLRDRAEGTTVRVNVSTTGDQANGYSQNPTGGHVIAAGPKVAFNSDASSLDPNDGNGRRDAFVRDLSAGLTTRLSTGRSGTETGGGLSERVVMSADGRFVAFHSTASNLVEDDTNNASDVFVRDTLTGATERVSLTDGGAQADGWSWDPAITPDGRYVAFSSSSGNIVPGTGCCASKIYVRDRKEGRTRWVSDMMGRPVNGDCYRPAISADGSRVAFLSWASDLVADDTNNTADWFWRDLNTGQTKRISVSNSGEQGNDSSDTWLCASLSDDGRFVAFASYASNLAPGDANNASDVFVYDTEQDRIECASVTPAGVPGETTSWWASMSGDGRYVAFMSDASNLVPNDTNGQADIFVRDRTLRATTRVSVTSSGAQCTGNSRDPMISRDGRFVAFRSSDGNLVSGDTNGATDIVVKDTLTGAVARISVNDAEAPGNGESVCPASVSADGRFVAFQSAASNLVPNDRNTAWDIFVRGPLPVRYTLADSLAALRAAAGTWAPTAPERARLDAVRTPPSAGRVDLSDATALLRKATGLDPNP